MEEPMESDNCRPIKNKVEPISEDEANKLQDEISKSKTSIMLELDIANTTTSVIEASVEVLDSSVSASAWRYLVKNAPVPTGGALMVIAGQKIVLEAGDKVRVTSSAASSMDVVAAILEDVNS